MIQKDKSASLRTNNYQTVFAPVYAVDQYNGDMDKVEATLGANCGISTGRNAVMVCDARGNGDGSTVGTITGDHENRITDFSHILIQSIGINGEIAGTLDSLYYKGCGMRQNVERDVVAVPIHDQATRFQGKRGKMNDGKGNGLGVGDTNDPMFTLTGGDHHAVAIGNGQMCNITMKEIANSLDCMHDQQAVMRMENAKYIVRRLTPTECCRLQGFPDGWGEIDHKDSFSKEECNFWNEVRKTFAEFTGKPVKEYTEEQLLKWYNGLHTDSAEYKMWGNGIALPTALYVMDGIAEELNEDCN